MDDLLNFQRSILHQKPKRSAAVALDQVDPIPDLSKAERTLSRGEVACVILAGGMGSRLNNEGPKGCLRLPEYDNKSLFEIALEKAGDMPVAVMSSPLNHQETLDALQGTGAEIFSQGTMPFLSMEEEWIGDLSGPDGNGGVFLYLQKIGILEEWKEKGVRYITVMPIDNPKANPVNFAQIAAVQDVDLVVTAVENCEATGTIVMRDGNLHVAEYMEEKVEGQYGYSGLFACSMDFAKRAADCELPWHVVKKQVQGQDVWKFERFIFDLFPHAKSFKVIFQPRSECFAPIKTREDI